MRHPHTLGEPPPAKRVRLIGRRDDLLAAGPWHGADVLEVADSRWSAGLNVRWVREGLLARQSFRAVSARSPANLRQRTRGGWRPTVFARELEWLARAGYVPADGLWVPPERAAAGRADTFITWLLRDPAGVYARLHARALAARKRGATSFPFPELAPVVDRMLSHLRGVSQGPGAEEGRALAARARALRALGTPYPDVLRVTHAFVEWVDARVRVQRPELPRVYGPKCRDELEPLLDLWPHVLSVPTFATLERRDFWRTRPVPLHLLGLQTEALFADGLECSPAEYFFHDVDHARFLVREELLARGIDIPDAYRDGSTLDKARGRHRTVLDAAHGTLHARGSDTLARLQARCRLARALDSRQVAGGRADAGIRESAGWLLFEVVHEKGFPLDARVLAEQLARETHVNKLGAKLRTGFYGQDAQHLLVAGRLPAARAWLARQVDTCR